MKTAKQVILNASDSWMSGMEVCRVWQRTSKDIQEKIGRSDLYQKSTDEGKSIICELEQIARTECNITQENSIEFLVQSSLSIYFRLWFIYIYN